MVAPLNARGFYDKDKTGNTREVRNDLGGSLPGMVQFAQSHTVDPSGNEAKDMPRLTMSREAMVLITPNPSIAAGVTSLQVTVTLNGATMGTLNLRAPDAIYRADYTPTDGRPDYVYSRRAWTGVLPWQWVQPGMELRVADNQGRSGILQANAIDFGGAGELVVMSVRLGMLTPPITNSNGHWFRINPADAATDYFQTIPAAKMTAGYYEDVQLSRVMVASGVIYDSKSAVTGDVYSGDMRENTGKSTFSVGINLANYGVTSSGMASQAQPQTFQIATIHHARGAYSNGLVNHGLSGGNSILTLIDSRGNEFSHEIGHHYGLGHYPGEVNGNYFLSAHHHDSGWGFIAYRKRMRSNIHWSANVTGGLAGQATLDNTYRFSTDAMAGGNYTSALSGYTHYTGYSTKKAIQPALMQKPVLTTDSPTGYQQWNASTRKMENIAPAVPSQSAVWYNGMKTFLAPRLQGTQVVTLLGGYDPVTNKALIYPPLRGNWGNVFNLPSESTLDEPRKCWLDVRYRNGQTSRIAVAGKRMEGNPSDLTKFNVNKLHVNLAVTDDPSQATLNCQTKGAPNVETLTSIDIPHYNASDMPEPVRVGKEYGYAALRAKELPTLDKALSALATKDVLTLGSSDQLLLDSWRDNANELSAGARLQLQRYDDQQTLGLRLNRWMTTYSADLAKGVPEAQNALVAFIRQLGFKDDPLVPAAQSMKMANGNCIQKYGDSVRVAGPALCTGGADEQWILDARGAIHSRSDLGMCLTSQGGNATEVKLTACDASKERQVWDTSTPKRIFDGSRCLDLNTGKLGADGTNKLIIYTCTGGANQEWSGLLPGNSLLLSMLSADNAKLLEGVQVKRSAAYRR